MSQYTKGPWKIARILNDTEGATAEIDAPDHGALAEVVWRMQDDDESPVCEANARLIAAAPDLLEALKAAQEILTHCKADAGYSKQQTRVAIQINEALSKAEAKS